MAKKHLVSWAKCKLAAGKKLPFKSDAAIERMASYAGFTCADAYRCGAEEPMMCEACSRGDHANCGMQTWCACDNEMDGDHVAARLPAPWLRSRRGFSGS